MSGVVEYVPKVRKLSQPKYKQLAKLLREWQRTFAEDHNRPYGLPEDTGAQPHYGDIIGAVARYVEGQIE